MPSTEAERNSDEPDSVTTMVLSQTAAVTFIEWPELVITAGTWNSPDQTL